MSDENGLREEKLDCLVWNAGKAIPGVAHLFTYENETMRFSFGRVKLTQRFPVAGLTGPIQMDFERERTATVHWLRDSAIDENAGQTQTFDFFVRPPGARSQTVK